MAEFHAMLLEWLTIAQDWVWGPIMLVLLVCTGLYLSFLLKGLQFRTLPRALYLALIKRKEEGDAEGSISHFQALMTALAATVGTGNIAGVAVAIAVGGPGALFWMWITGLVGMATKYSEAILSCKYREFDEEGNPRGGPMYYLRDGLKQPWLGWLYALFAVVASFGIGNMVQANSVSDGLEVTIGRIPEVSGFLSTVAGWFGPTVTGEFVFNFIVGGVLAILTGLVILGGIKSIARVTSTIVPIMIVGYFGAGLFILIVNFNLVPEVFGMVFASAFTGSAAVGGFAGAVIMKVVQQGVSKGVFSNESGLGSAGIAAAAAKTKYPATQALVSMTQTFIDTIVVCTVTGFVIIASGLWSGGLNGAELTTQAFASLTPFGLGDEIVAFGLVFFAYSTLLGWSYYGEKSIEYLLGRWAIMPYRMLFCVVVWYGAINTLDLVWAFSDVMNALMAIPNLIGLLLLSVVVKRETDRALPFLMGKTTQPPE
ncbi:MAG TPA: sodium:alanine symporter family protein [Planctomycetota bacterium]|nr:sodium:alanine symporter family protein [Planctomycetota bacterium]